MIEVFKTDVTDAIEAARILDALHSRHTLYVANFDLADCDRVLRVKCLMGIVDADRVLEIVSANGYTAVVMEDVLEPG